MKTFSLALVLLALAFAALAAAPAVGPLTDAAPAAAEAKKPKKPFWYTNYCFKGRRYNTGLNCYAKRKDCTRQRRAHNSVQNPQSSCFSKRLKYYPLP